MDFNDRTTKEIFIKNLFSILSADKGSRIFGKQSFACAIRELALTKDIVQAWFNEWKENPGKLLLYSDDENAKKNREMALYICSALLADELVPNEMMQFLHSFASQCGIVPAIINSIFSNKIQYISEPSFLKRGKILYIAYASNGTSVTTSTSRPRIRQIQNTRFYVANQVSSEGIDELQRLIIAYRLGCHAAIDGPPGVGKTHCITEIANILGLNLYTKTCSNRTTESHIISYPVLGVQNGASVTTHVNGPLVNAMIDPGIFYGDEFNLLKEDVQKRMNSAFDERRYIDRNDGVQIHAKPGFWATISYNPSQNLTARDLEDSVADRFVHYHFSRWPAGFKAYVAHRKACVDFQQRPVSEKEFDIQLSWRGISSDGEFFVCTQEEGKIKWKHFFTGKPASEPDYVYQVNDASSLTRGGGPTESVLQELERNALTELSFAQLLAKFTDTLQTLAKTGRSPLLKKIGLGDIIEEEDLELLSLHESSARIEVAALKHYRYLTGKGFNRYLAQSYATRLVIDQVCYGQFREKKTARSFCLRSGYHHREKHAPSGGLHAL